MLRASFRRDDTENKPAQKAGLAKKKKLMGAYSKKERRTSSSVKPSFLYLTNNAQKELATNGSNITSFVENKKRPHTFLNLKNDRRVASPPPKSSQAMLALNELKFRTSNGHIGSHTGQDKHNDVIKLNSKINDKLSKVIKQWDSSLQSLLATARALAGSGSHEDVRPFMDKAIGSLVIQRSICGNK